MIKTRDERIFQIISWVIVAISSLLCALPFLLILSGSFSTETSILKHGYSLLPKEFTLDAYLLAFKLPERMLNSYKITMIITIVGGGMGLFLTAMTSYVLARPDFVNRNRFAMFFYFPSIFSGGLIPSYILVANYLNLKNNIFSLILPSLLSAWNIFLMRNFMKGIPDSLAESAKIDGANDFYIFIRIYLPLTGPGLATIGLFIALMYWNDWFHAMLYINKPDLYPLQYLLYQMLSSIEAIQEAAQKSGNIIAGQSMPTESFKMAMSVIVTGPILLLFPFIQKYFVKGLTVGAVKG